MIPLAEINNAANRLNVPAETIEKDYAISWILFYLSKSKIKDNFIFYGGTAIKRIYFENHRFSEDIDLLSHRSFTRDNLLQELDILQSAHTDINLSLEVDLNTVVTSNDRVQLFINYSGYEEIIGSPKKIRMDFTMDRRPYGEVSSKKIIASYSDMKIKNETLPVMTLNTILANKLGLLYDPTRNEPRDVFDIWFLLQRKNEFDFSFHKINKIVHEKHGFFLSLGGLKSHLKNPSLRKNWILRLKKQMAELPPIEKVIKDIENKLDKLF